MRFSFTPLVQLSQGMVYKVTVNGILLGGDIFDINSAHGGYWLYGAPPSERADRPRFLTAHAAALALLERERECARVFLAATEEPDASG